MEAIILDLARGLGWMLVIGIAFFIGPGLVHFLFVDLWRLDDREDDSN